MFVFRQECFSKIAETQSLVHKIEVTSVSTLMLANLYVNVNLAQHQKALDDQACSRFRRRGHAYIWSLWLKVPSLSTLTQTTKTRNVRTITFNAFVPLLSPGTTTDDTTIRELRQISRFPSDLHERCFCSTTNPTHHITQPREAHKPPFA